jgi:sugar phosphate isomerase/epimerase
VRLHAHFIGKEIVRMDRDMNSSRRQSSGMKNALLCSFHTISGVMPGSAIASRHPLEQRLAALSRAGFAGYWLHFRDYLEHRAASRDDAAIGALFDEAGIRYRGVEFLGDWFIETEEARAMEQAAFAAARAIGASVLNVGADFQGRGFARSHMVEAFARLCARAQDQGLAVALEFVPWSDVPDLRAALDFMEPANAGIVIDAWHVFRGTTKLAELSQIPADKILCIQVNDAAPVEGPLPEDTQRRRFCGEGEFDLQAFISALRKTGTETPLSVEVISREVAAMPLEAAARRSFDTAASLR